MSTNVTFDEAYAAFQSGLITCWNAITDSSAVVMPLGPLSQSARSASGYVSPMMGTNLPAAARSCAEMMAMLAAIGGTADNVPPIAANIAIISAQLRAAAGRLVPIIGLTYPDADLADWLSGPSGITTAEESVICLLYT